MASLRERISAFEKAASDANNSQVMASKISEKSDRKKYDFANGLKRDLGDTRAALRACCEYGNEDSPYRDARCTFGALFHYTEGRIANLNRVLQNLRQAREVHFIPECFFAGRHDEEFIILLQPFWSEPYTVDKENLFRPPGRRAMTDVPEEQRRGRSYVKENLATQNIYHCAACKEQVKDEQRITIRAEVFHMRCLQCAVCEASLHVKADYVTFDGRICCSSDCVMRYDGAHVRQKRNQLL